MNNRKYVGKYLHYNLDKVKFSTENNDHYSIITIKLFKPNILSIVSYDFTTGIERIWTGEIKIDSETHLFGHGSFKYKNSTDSGMHNIYFVDNDIICVQIFDFRASNPNASQLWIKDGSKHINNNGI